MFLYFIALCIWQPLVYNQFQGFPCTGKTGLDSESIPYAKSRSIRPAKWETKMKYIGNREKLKSAFQSFSEHPPLLTSWVLYTVNGKGNKHLLKIRKMLLSNHSTLGRCLLILSVSKTKLQVDGSFLRANTRNPFCTRTPSPGTTPSPYLPKTIRKKSCNAAVHRNAAVPSNPASPKNSYFNQVSQHQQQVAPSHPGLWTMLIVRLLLNR